MEKSKHGRVSGIELLDLFCVNHGKRLYRAKCVNSRDKQREDATDPNIRALCVRGVAGALGGSH